MKNKVDTVRNIYLFGVSIIGIIFLIIGILRIVDALSFIYFSSEGIKTEHLYYYQNLYQGIVMALLGLLIFIFHWYFIVKEKRLGKMRNIEYESSMNFFEAIFFYLLSFIGIIIFISSSMGLVSGLYNIKYPPPVFDNNGKIIQETPPYVTTDMGKVIKSGISMLIGLATFLIGFLKTQISMKKVDSQEINT
ncbi:MAG: DUF5671 domain-containing protein [Caldisericum sp.]|jgi:hypothetical protein|uniref:DUF5671 domain-containing protein n=1 Tax=Caldisericum sp. TaxID=2499687 RepID=UPI003D0FA953